MKQYFLIFLCFLFIFPIGGCASAPADETGMAVSGPETAQAVSPTPTAEPTPTPLPMPKPVAFTFDRYALPADLTDYLAVTGLTDDWVRLVDVLFSGGTVLDAVESAKSLCAVFAASPYDALAALTCSGDRIEIAYTGAGTPEALESAVKDFVESALFEEMNTLETALALYRSAASGLQYEESDQNSLYRALVEKKGASKEFAAALQYLYASVGIPAYLAQGSADDFTHWWVITELNGAPSHLDPVFENSATGGLGLSYFGMSDAAHQEAGCKTKYRIGFDKLSEQHDALCPASPFDDLFSGVTAWQPDPLLHQIELSYLFDETNRTTVSTETLGVG